MILSHTRYADVVVLAPKGRIDHATSEGLRAALEPHLAACAAGRDHVVLDLAGVDFISSAGLRILMLAAKQAKAQRGFLAVAAVQPLVGEILEISKFTLVLRTLSSVRDAVAAASPAGLAAFEGRWARMRVRFWGTRGSIPVATTPAAIRRKLVHALTRAIGRGLDTPEKVEAFVDRELDITVGGTFGGNSSCVELEGGGEGYVLCDLGSGARVFGNHVLAARKGVPATYHVFMSHLHWDHIVGFPFFLPIYIPGNTIIIYGGHAELEAAFRRQHGAPSFPVEWKQLSAEVRFVRLEPGRTYDLAGFRVTPKRQRHTGDSYGYRFERQGRSVVYSTDSEHKLDDPAATQAFAEFFRDADLVIFDAQYSLADAVSIKEDWGHSSNVVGVELCQMARVKHLCMFHHEPLFDDDQLRRVLAETRRLEEITRGETRLEVSSAYDGMEIELRRSR
jgi:anti-anti-sigma factor